MATKPAPSEKPARQPPAPAAQPTAAPAAPPPPAFLHAPRDTTEDPWRDLHPLRVWPD